MESGMRRQSRRGPNGIADPATQTTQVRLSVPEPETDPIAAGCREPARRGVRASAALLDLAAMASPALPLSAAAAALSVAELVYLVLPVASAAIWAWTQVWQGLTGTSFGKGMLGLRLVRPTDHRPGGPGRVLLRSAVFLITGGLAALPVLRSGRPCPGWHDRLSGLTVIDLTDHPCRPLV